MPAIGSLRVELELDDGSFTTRIIRAGTSLQQLNNTVNGTVVAVRKLDGGFSEAGNAISKLTLTLGLAREAIQTVYFVFGSWAVSIAKTSGEIQRLNTLLTNMSTAITDVERAAEGNKATTYLLDMARTSPFAISALTDAFVKLRAGGLDPTTGSMRGLVDAVAAFGGTSQSLDRAATAIQQMAGKGVISMEELRQQLGEAVPSALPLLARALGQTVDELVKNISNGKVRAAPALQALSNEFERTFGGRALAMMDTFNGQLQQVTNNFQRLQNTAGGGDSTIGFLGRLTAAFTSLNAFMVGPEAQGFAVRLGQNLAGIVDALAGAVEWIYKFRSELMLAAQVAAAATGLALLRTIVMSLGGGLNYLVISLTSLAGASRALTLADLTAAMGRATVATFAFSTAIVSNLSIAMAGLVTRVALTVASLTTLNVALMAVTAVGAVGGFLGAIGAAVGLAGGAAIAFGAMFLPFIVGGVAYAAYTLLTQINSAVFNLGASAVSAASAVGPNFSVIGDYVSDLVRRFKDLFSSSNAAYERIQMGASDTGTVIEVEQQRAKIQEGIKRARENQERITAAQSNGRSSTALQSIDGAGQTEDFGGGYRRQAELITSYAAQTRIIEQGEKALEAMREQVDAANERRRDQLADNALNARLARISREGRAEQTAYTNAAEQIAADLRKVDEARNSGQERGENDLARAAVLERSFQGKSDLYQGQIARFDAALAQVNRELAAALQSGDEQAIASARRMQTEFTNRITAARATLAGLRDEGKGSLITGSDQATQDRQLKTAMDNMLVRIEELRAKTQGLGTELAKVNQQLELKEFGNIGNAKAEELRQLATALDEANAAAKRFAAAQQAMGAIDTGLNQQKAQLDGYIVSMTNPAMPEAQRSFIAFQERMRAALATVGAAVKDTSAEYVAASEQINSAINMAAASSALQQMDTIIKQARSYELGSMSASDRARAEVGDRQSALTQARQASAEARRRFAGAAADSDGAKTIAALEAREALLNAASDRFTRGAQARIASAGAPAAAKEENAITRLTARLAEMTAETANSGTEFAKQYAILERTGKVGTAYGNEVERLSKLLDEQTLAAKAAGEALQSLEEIKRMGRESGTRQNELAGILDNPNASEQDRQLINARAKVAESLRKIGLDPNQDMGAAQTAANSAIASRAGELAINEAIKQRDATRQVTEGLAESNGARRQIAMDNLNIEENQTRALIALSDLSAEREKQALDTLTAYRNARAQQIARNTEGATAKMMRDWSNVTDSMDKTFATAMDGMADSLTNFVMTGKLNFGDLAKSIIADLIKIQIKAAAVQVFGMIVGAVSGTGGSGISGGQMSGLSTTASNNTAGGAAGLHSGGISGSEATFTRMISGAHFANAPRFHSGIGPNEQAAILEKGEGVFTKGQMAAIGDMNRSYQFVEGMLARMASMMQAPASVAPSAPSAQGSSGNNAIPGITINMINQTDQPANAMAGTPKFDGEKMILDVVIKAAGQPGPMRDALRGV